MAIPEPTRRVLRNTLWNLGGSLVPIPIALICIPMLISGLGVERFGILAIAWTVMAYFGLFDFGLSQSTTRFVAAEVERGRLDTLQGLMRGSLLIHGALGICGAALFTLLVPWFTDRVFSIPSDLASETRAALYWLAASIPAIVATSALRGVLEGMQRFDIVNLIRVPSSIVNYLAPVIALLFGAALEPAIAVIAISRFAVLGACAYACMITVPAGHRDIRLQRTRLVALATFGGWLTVSNLVNPLIIVADRFIIAATVSVAAVAFYVTPYEIITKMWILSASLMGAMFPVLSALAAREPVALRPACRAAEMHLICLTAPAAALLLGCADWLLEAWLGPDFRDRSTPVAHWLAVGVLINVIAQVPLTALHALGRADVTAKIVAAELPFYLLAVVYCAGHYGINGVAAVWAARAAIDAIAVFACAHAILPKGAPGNRALIGFTDALLLMTLLASFWLVGINWRDDWAMRVILLALLLAVMLSWEWGRLLTRESREQLLRALGSLAGMRAR